MSLFYSEKGFLKAARNGDAETLKKYLASSKAGAMIALKDKTDTTALHLTAQSGHIECFKLLLSSGADLRAKTKYHQTVLHMAAAQTYDFLAFVIQAGLKPDDSLLNGSDSPLSLATARNRVDNVRLLLESGADVNDRSALTYAFRHRYVEIANLLVKKGADINMRDNYYHYTPLHFVSSNGMIELFELLMAQENIDINAKSKDGSTPLHLAAAGGHILLVEGLLKAGADANVEDNNGDTPASVALKHRQQQAAKIIQKKTQQETETEEKQILYAVPTTDTAPQDRETWLRIGDDKIAHIGIYPALERKLTDIFNFTTRERLTISENLRTGVESTLPTQSFDSLPETALDAAFDAYQAQGGKTDRNTIIKKRLSPK